MSWIVFLEKELNFLLHFPTLSELSGLKYPKAYREISNLRGIIDCTEFYIEQTISIIYQFSINFFNFIIRIIKEYREL